MRWKNYHMKKARMIIIKKLIEKPDIRGHKNVYLGYIGKYPDTNRYIICTDTELHPGEEVHRENKINLNLFTVCELCYKVLGKFNHHNDPSFYNEGFKDLVLDCCSTKDNELVRNVLNDVIAGCKGYHEIAFTPYEILVNNFL